MARPQPARITSFLVKMASRCNLACDYCYVYRHADQSWRDMPALMGEPTRRQLASRIGEYARAASLNQVLLVFHGGEPLLAGHAPIVETVEWVRSAVPPGTRVDASLQTNGLLLTDEALRSFGAHAVSVSVSIDGPQAAHDLHRLTHQGASSYTKTLDAIRRLARHPDIYAGLIAVVDPCVSPDELLSFFHEMDPPNLDFLLPDAHHLRLPPGRERDPDLYLRWLLRAFDLWFDRYPDLRVRTFDALLGSVAGLPSATDAFGLGDVSLLSVETDGSYHDLDVLKITRQGSTNTGLTVWDATIAEAAVTPQIEAHRSLLTLEGLSELCHECPQVRVCGGGAVPHRYAGDGFRHPTVYCREMFQLIRHAKGRYRDAVVGSLSSGGAANPDFVVSEADLTSFDDPVAGAAFVGRLWRRFAARQLPDFHEALRSAQAVSPTLAPLVDEILGGGDEVNLRLAAQPSVVLWSSVTRRRASGSALTAIDGTLIEADPDYVREIHAWSKSGLPAPPRLHRPDPFLRLPFGKQIVFEPEDVLRGASDLAGEALRIVRDWNPALADEIGRLSPEIQFIRDPSAHPDKAVSFSDNSVPGALYVSVRRGVGWLTPHDLADSIVHEHRHQKLYLLQAACPIVAVDAPLIRSPWRADLRPPSGLFHAVFVFSGLLRYWQHVERTSADELKEYAGGEVRRIQANLGTARPVLMGTALTGAGRRLACALFDASAPEHRVG